MTVRQIRLFGDPVLSSPCQPVDVGHPATSALVQDLLDTVELPGRAGVAAPQIGVDARAFSYLVDGVTGYVLNPTLVETRGEPVLTDEGCLSVPGLWHQVLRAPWAKVEGVDLDGQPVTLEGDGLMAQMLQHECDHLDGVVYIRRLVGDERTAAYAALRQQDWFNAD